MIFAVEIAFLFPWAIVLRDAVYDTGAAAGAGIGAFALIEGVLFIVILFLGLAYVWAKGDLDWVLSYRDDHYAPPSQRSRVALPSVKELEEAANAEDESEEEADEDAAA